MQRRHALGVLAVSVLSGGIDLKSAPFQDHAPCNQHTDWVAQVLTRMQTIKPGMSRKELAAVFTTEGGLSFRTERTYVSKDCPFFKVRVEFKTQQGSQEDHHSVTWNHESDDDVITKISDPYLQFSIMD
jgi:hypothetical protein